ncbi:ATP-dependent DNA helicase [Trichonephila clavipes]|nr:ATP-dependent DNA helicase [Trichonephila clavipes]
MKRQPLRAKELFSAKYPDVNFETASVCARCHLALGKNKIPTLSKSNGFKYLSKLPHLPELDLISARLISPRLLFMTIQSLGHGNGLYGILGQIISVPVSVDNMVKTRPRDLDDDYAISVHIRRKKYTNLVI